MNLETKQYWMDMVIVWTQEVEDEKKEVLAVSGSGIQAFHFLFSKLGGSIVVSICSSSRRACDESIKSFDESIKVRTKMSGFGSSTAGAIPVLNEKGEVTMQKVKVQRYVTGKKPEFADTDSESEEDELQEAISKRNQESRVQMVIASTSRIKEEEDEPIPEEVIKSDRRLQRLMNRVNVASDESDRRRHRRDVKEPEILAVGEGDRRRHRRESSGEEEDDSIGRRHRRESSGEEEDDSIERRHALVKEMKPGSDEEEVLDRDEESDEESEYEEYTDSEEETVPRLKPIFVRKEARVTAKEREIEEKKEKEREELAIKEGKERREQALKMIQEDKKREEKEREEKDEDEAMRLAINAVMTDDEDEETSYELWKVRELKRIKREKEEREGHVKELEEIEKLRNMTEEERQIELEKNPKIITNQFEKSKYKFLQKYYHRGAFYLDEENDVFKRDIAQPTLEDHHDKEVLPKVMQVKNFGRSGRTKYTHLVDQDTTARDSPWIEETPQTSKFFSTQAAGMKPIFDRPSKRRKHD